MKLPKNWSLVSLDEVAAPEKGAIRRGPFGGSIKKEIFVADGYKVYEQQNAIESDFAIGHYFIDDRKYKEMDGFRIQTDDLIISCAGTIGRIAIVPSSARPGIINQALMRIRPNTSLITPHYLKWFLESPLAQCNIFGRVAGTALKNLVAISEIKKSQIPLPPLEEQCRIVGILDKADAVRRKRQSAIALTEELLRSAFVEMFGDPGKNPHQWTTGYIGNIAEFVTDGTHQTPIRSDNGVMLLSARNIKNGYIDISENVDFVPQYEYERLRQSYDPKQQDVLISCSGSVGRVTVVRDFGSFSMVRSVAVVRPKLEFINSEFFESLLHSAYLRASMVKGTKQSSQANLFQGAIKELPVILPPLYLQEQWETFKLRVRETAKRYSQMQDSQTELFNSLLQKAFRGQL